MGRHAAEQIAAFTGGETAQVIARDTRTGDLVFMPKGKADDFRPDTKAYYECPVPGCDAARPLTTRGQSKRDHFVHQSRHSHPGGLESQFHIEGKHRIADWARLQGVWDLVDVEVSEEVWDAGAKRQADVMVTWPDGRRVAFEIEYKTPTPAEWAAKAADYERNGIVGVWLFGHLQGRHLRRDTRLAAQPLPGEAPRFRLTPLTEAVTGAGRPLLFINPTEALIGTLYEAGRPLEVAQATDRGWWRKPDPVGDPVPPRADRRVVSASLGVVDLYDCQLDPYQGIVTPTMRAIQAESARVEDARRAAREAHDAAEQEARRRHAAAAEEARLRRALNAQPGDRGHGQTGDRACLYCGLKIDPILTEHILCGPRARRR